MSFAVYIDERALSWLDNPRAILARSFVFAAMVEDVSRQLRLLKAESIQLKTLDERNRSCVWPLDSLAGRVYFKRTDPGWFQRWLLTGEVNPEPH